MDKIFAGLNKAQKQAVDTLSGPLLILAGAGSGKTKTLTNRIANLIAHGISPYEILAVTFTNKAAGEMRTRLAHLLGTPDSRNFMPWMGTFHGICVKFLRIEHEAAGIDQNFVIYDTTDRLALIKHSIRTLDITDKQLKPKSIEAAISKAKNAGLSPADYADTAIYPNQKSIAKIYAHYEKERKKASALDFDDLLLETANLLRTNKDVRLKWQSRFRHILIDEYQDTNALQYQIVRALVGPDRNICVVGDDWQSIYSWRGADFTNILNFERDFPGALVIKLEQNYRSTGHILDASQKIITKNKQRTDKTLFTKSGQGNPITIQALRDGREEASWVASQILSLNRPFSDFAVLYRTNAQSRAFEEAFIAAAIPYKLIGGVRFYDRKEIKDILAYLRLLINPSDAISLQRIANVPARGLGDTSIRHIMTGNLAALTPRAGAALNQLNKILASLRAHLTAPPADIITALIAKIDYKDFLKDGTPQGEERVENLTDLVANASSYDTLEAFLENAALMSSSDETNTQDSVTLMTLHSAKGLEFPVVFLVGLEEGLLPHSRASEFGGKEEDLEEERRLAYVGMTRAMQDLFLTYARARYTYSDQGPAYSHPSRFLADLGHNPYASLELEDLEDPFPEDDLPIFE